MLSVGEALCRWSTYEQTFLPGSTSASAINPSVLYFGEIWQTVNLFLQSGSRKVTLS